MAFSYNAYGHKLSKLELLIFFKTRLALLSVLLFSALRSFLIAVRMQLVGLGAFTDVFEVLLVFFLSGH